MSDARNRIVTPYTDPDRWTPEEKAVFDQGRCAWVVEYGNGPSVVYCMRPSKPGASMGHCGEHDAEMLECHWPDGSPRRSLGNGRYEGA